MKFFGKGKRENVIDLSERYLKQKERLSRLKENIKPAQKVENASVSPTPNSFGFLGNLASSNSQNSYNDFQELPIKDSEGKRKKLAKRLMSLTEKLEELSTQMYHLQQRVEFLERKEKSSF